MTKVKGIILHKFNFARLDRHVFINLLYCYSFILKKCSDLGEFFNSIGKSQVFRVYVTTGQDSLNVNLNGKKLQNLCKNGILILQESMPHIDIASQSDTFVQVIIALDSQQAEITTKNLQQSMQETS